MSLILASLVFSAMTQPRSLDKYTEEVSKWRLETEADLKRDDGWLAVAGLCWLEEGATSFRLTQDGHLFMPSKDTRGSVGSFVRVGRKVIVNIVRGAGVAVNGKDVESAELTGADKVTIGPITMIVIERGTRIGVRVYDTENFARKEFTGLKWFPIDPAFRIKAKYTAYDKPKQMQITNVLGDTAPVPNPGYVEFNWKGKNCRLEAQDAGEGLFINFRDLTSGKTTYPAGRFLDAPKPKDGYVTIDFNRATNPPCAFTDFATCPLPPKKNWLALEINAGEKTYHIHGDRK